MVISAISFDGLNNVVAELKKKGKELARLRHEVKYTRYLVALYELHFPWLTEMRDDEDMRAFLGDFTDPDDTAAAEEAEQDTDRAQKDFEDIEVTVGRGIAGHAFPVQPQVGERP